MLLPKGTTATGFRKAISDAGTPDFLDVVQSAQRLHGVGKLVAGKVVVAGFCQHARDCNDAPACTRLSTSVQHTQQHAAEMYCLETTGIQEQFTYCAEFLISRAAVSVIAGPLSRPSHFLPTCALITSLCHASRKSMKQKSCFSPGL